MPIINDNGTGMYMPVAPAYNGGGFGNGFGGDGWWIILLLLCGWGGMGGYDMGGFGGGLGIDFPWILNGQNNINANTNNGFRDQMINDNVTSIRDGVANLSTQLCGCCGDMQMALANGFAGVQQSLCNGFANTTAAVTGAQNALTGQLYQNEIASLNRSFAEQQANQAGFTGVNTGIADLKYTEATEACATRTAAYQNTRDIVDAIRSGNQGIMDKLCQLELDGVKSQYAQAQRENLSLQNQLNMAAFRESQANQNALFQQGLTNEVDALYNRLKNCPVGTTPVYGNQPIFTCPQNAYSGCGCGVA
jgi:hypothetical protein